MIHNASKEIDEYTLRKKAAEEKAAEERAKLSALEEAAEAVTAAGSAP